MELLKALQQRVLVCDGANGTQLQGRGMLAGVCPEVWAIQNLQVVRQIHADYLASGADIILSSTLGGNSYQLGKHNVDLDASEISHQLAKTALETIAPGQFVLGDVGPTGKFMQPLGLHTEDDFLQAFADQCKGFAEAGVHGIIVETMMDLNEARAAVQAAKQTELPVVASMSYNLDANGFRTMMGVAPEQATEALLNAGADVIEHMPLLVEQMKRAGAPWVSVAANAGLPEVVDGRTVFRQTPERMADSVRSVIEAGANIIGGCCGTTPQHIQAIANIVKGR